MIVTPYVINLTKTTTYNETPLHIAAKFARADAAKQILQCGADPNVKGMFTRVIFPDVQGYNNSFYEV